MTPAHIALCLACVAAFAAAAPPQPATDAADAAAAAAASATPSSTSFWKDTALEGIVAEVKKQCVLDQDQSSMACVKYRLLHFVDQLMTKDDFDVSDAVSVVRTPPAAHAEGPGAEGRSAEGAGAGAGAGLLQRAAAFVDAHALRMRLPGGTVLSASAARLDQGVVDLALDLGASHAAPAADVSEARHRKLKKIIIPVLVLVMLKAITLVPLFIGALGLKAWNALQLAFFSFAISVGMAIFQLCRRLAADSALPHLAPAPVAAAGWEPHFGRGFGAGAGPELAFRAHAPQPPTA